MLAGLLAECQAEKKERCVFFPSSVCFLTNYYQFFKTKFVKCCSVNPHFIVQLRFVVSVSVLEDSKFCNISKTAERKRDVNYILSSLSNQFEGRYLLHL